MNMREYEKEMISYINSLSAQELERAIIAAGAKKVDAAMLMIENIPVEEFDNDIKYSVKYSVKYSTEEPIELNLEVGDRSIEINCELLNDEQDSSDNLYKYRKAA